MKSKISFFNKAIFKRNMSGGAALWSGFVTMYLITMPLVLYTTLNDGQWIREVAEDARVRVVEHAVIEHLWNQNMFVPIYACAAIITAMHLFSYLFTSRNSNMMHTYPVNRSSLFGTNYISGIIYLTVPQIFASILVLFVGALSGGGTALVVKSWIIWIGVMFVENLFFFSLSICVLMFVGNIIAVPVLYLILNFFYRGCLMIVEAMVMAACYGVSSLRGNVIGVLTPVLYMSSMIGVTASSGGDSYTYHMWGTKALFGYLAAAALLTLIAWVTYQKKHIETAGDVITVEWMKPIFRWGVAICTSALGACFFGAMFLSKSYITIVVFGMITGIIAFFIAQMLMERSFRVFYRKRIRECIVYAAVMCACYISLDADVLGYEKVIPAENEIDMVKVRGEEMNLYAVSEDEISWVRDIHKQIIDSKSEFESYMKTDGMYQSISLDYILKDGSHLERYYYIPDLTEKESVSGQITAYARETETVLKEYFGVHYPDIEVYGGRIEWFDMENYTPDRREIRLSEADTRRLYEAAVKDAQEGHFYFDDEEMETVSGFGNLIFDVRDEQGFLSVHDGGAFYDYNGEIAKEGYTEIWLNSAHTHLIETIDDLGYLSDDLRDILMKDENLQDRIESDEND